MGVDKIVLRRGNGIDVPKKHDEVSMEYTGKTIFSQYNSMSDQFYRLALRRERPEQEGQTVSCILSVSIAYEESYHYNEDLTGMR
jgi:hypothetical protein